MSQNNNKHDSKVEDFSQKQSKQKLISKKSVEFDDIEQVYPVVLDNYQILAVGRQIDVTESISKNGSRKGSNTGGKVD